MRVRKKERERKEFFFKLVIVMEIILSKYRQNYLYISKDKECLFIIIDKLCYSCFFFLNKSIYSFN